MVKFQQVFGISGRTRILDLGGTPACWELLQIHPKVVFLNTPRALSEEEKRVPWVAGDGCRLPFRDQSFDVVFCNSVIEHAGGAANQARMAEEIARVGNSYWVETPNRRFPVEQHLLTPFIHFLPKLWQKRAANRFTVWALLTRPSPDRWEYYINHFLNEINLLDGNQLSTLFPAAQIWRERVCGITKSLIAVKL